MIDDSETAFPVAEIRGPDGCGLSEGSRGMSLRDWFAGQALAAIDVPGIPASEFAKIAYQLADAMMAARKEKP